jgi:CRISPR/Cas system-associated exonuclease Cas4 (RecB family)
MPFRSSVKVGNVCRGRAGTALVFASAAHLTACASSFDSGMAGLPASEFDRAYAAGYDVAAAERCGVPVDAGLVRNNLVETMKREGLDAANVDKAGRTFDKTRAEFTRKLQSRPEYCVTEYAIPRESLARYEKGEFSAR